MPNAIRVACILVLIMWHEVSVRIIVICLNLAIIVEVNLLYGVRMCVRVCMYICAEILNHHR